MLTDPVSKLTAGLNGGNWRQIVKPGQMTTEEIIDLCGDMKAILSVAKKIEQYGLDVIKERRADEAHLTSEYFDVSFKDEEGKVTLNRASILEEMGEQFVQKHEKQGDPFVVARFTRK